MASKESNPEYIYHYTSLDVLYKLLSNLAHDDEPDAIKEINYYLPFWATSLFYMNDPIEGAFMRKDLDKMYGTSSFVAHLCFGYIGHPCVISFSTKKDSLPMWKMYGSDYCGVCLEFDSYKLKEFVKEFGLINGPDTMLIDRCSYESGNIAFDLEKINKTFKQNKDDLLLGAREIDKQTKSLSFVKNSSWDYESEWRLLCWTHSLEFRLGVKSIIPYGIVKLPLDALTNVILGPNLDFEKTKDALRLMLNRYTGKYRVETIKIEKSKVHIQSF